MASLATLQRPSDATCNACGLHLADVHFMDGLGSNHVCITCTCYSTICDAFNAHNIQAPSSDITTALRQIAADRTRMWKSDVKRHTNRSVKQTHIKFVRDTLEREIKRIVRTRYGCPSHDNTIHPEFYYLGQDLQPVATCLKSRLHRSIQEQLNQQNSTIAEREETEVFQLAKIDTFVTKLRESGEEINEGEVETLKLFVKRHDKVRRTQSHAPELQDVAHSTLSDPKARNWSTISTSQRTQSLTNSSKNRSGTEEPYEHAWEDLVICSHCKLEVPVTIMTYAATEQQADEQKCIGCQVLTLLERAVGTTEYANCLPEDQDAFLRLETQEFLEKWQNDHSVGKLAPRIEKHIVMQCNKHISTVLSTSAAPLSRSDLHHGFASHPSLNPPYSSPAFTLRSPSNGLNKEVFGRQNLNHASSSTEPDQSSLSGHLVGEHTTGQSKEITAYTIPGARFNDPSLNSNLGSVGSDGTWRSNSYSDDLPLASRRIDEEIARLSQGFGFSGEQQVCLMRFAFHFENIAPSVPTQAILRAIWIKARLLQLERTAADTTL